MRVAQRLYEGVDIGGETVGLITYMRTDGVTIAQEALDGARALIAGDYGDRYLPEAPRQYKSKQKNAQEAHEAIRPTDIFRRPKDLTAHLDSDGLKLYELIWNRTVACQMASAELDQVAVDIDVDGGVARLRATGSTLISQFVDSFVVLFVAFYFLAPADSRWSATQVVSVGIINYIYKFIVAILLTPLIYLAHGLIDRYLGEQAEEVKKKAMEG
jgi:reverse gyrase